MAQVFKGLGVEARQRLMARLAAEGTPDAVANVLRLLEPAVAATALRTLPAALRAAGLLSLSREERDDILIQAKATAKRRAPFLSPSWAPA